MNPVVLQPFGYYAMLSFTLERVWLEENSAGFHLKRRSRGLRKPERRIEAKRLQYNGIHPSSSDEIDQRISFHALSYEMKLLSQAIHRNPVSLL
ncbi:unnamed protein product [Protopolystoma xenopodis]|uniref:Uncharacterized protein n=1 Tax=Protopolystoma xenopodis TaxID=117903 RepID=A0A3S5C5Q1_9PLAT|nr:unnamed protein product [Protopolystoma xenopodis]